MAMNRRLKEANSIPNVAVPVGTVDGDPLVLGLATGMVPAVADGDRNADGVTTANLQGSYDLTVKAIDAGGNSAVAVWDAIYFVDADTPKLSKKATGVLFGFAMSTLLAGATGTVEVKLLRR
jgi:hypothetical protein